MGSNSSFLLADGVQVRQEKFGLLFYDYRGPRLYFLPSGDLVSETFFDGKHTAASLIARIQAGHNWSILLIQERVSQVLELLKSKGLIHEQSVR